MDRSQRQVLDLLRSDEALLLAGLTAGSGPQFLHWLVSSISRVSGATYTFVGELCGDDWDRIRTLAVHGRGGPLDDFEYDLRGTPCADVLDKTQRVYPRGLSALFASSALPVDEGLESYAGVPLVDPGGRPLGLLAIVDDQPMDADRAASCVSWLTMFEARATTELVGRRSVRELRAMVPEHEPGEGTGALEPLTLSLARALHVRAAFVSRFSTDAPGMLRTCALALDGRVHDSVEYAVDTSAGAALADQETCFIRSGARASFPEDRLVALVDAESYVGVRIVGERGPLGHLGILHDRPVSRRLSDQPVFQVFRERVTAELLRREAERRRRIAERSVLELQRTESLGILAGGIAHDFNNLLVGVLGNADLLRGSQLPGEPARQIEEILVAAQRASELCDQMLAYSGRNTPTLSPVDLVRESESLSQLLRATISRGSTLGFRHQKPELTILADGVLLRQVLLNLITNAADAIGDGEGSITVETALVRLTPDDVADLQPDPRIPPGDYAMLRVSDSGCGMTEAIQARIFDPFFTTKRRGHGLGLAAMLGIVRAHRGGVRLFSRPGTGSTFSVYLPHSPSDARPEEPSPRPAPVRGVALLVDDEEAVRAVAGRMLRRAGYDVLSASDGDEALRHLSERDWVVDCVLLDLSMARMDGVETMRRIRQRSPRLPIVLTTGRMTPSARARLDDDPHAAYLKKPYRFDGLLGAIRTATETRDAGVDGPIPAGP